MALLEVVDSCYKWLDEKEKVVGIYFDLQKAFDSVDHNILLHKLYNYGIRGSMYSWLQNYLHDRKQYTVVNAISSSIDNVVFGVPQGSVLGSFLFLIYINDIYRCVSGEKLKLFADDTNLLISGIDFSELEIKANACLQKMETWFVANKLSLNTEKTCYTVFASKLKSNAHVSLNLFINGKKIDKVTSCKYLGVIIDQALTWNDHITYIYKRLIKFTAIFYKLRDILPFACLSHLYYAFVHPVILYGIEVYANACKTALDKLIKLNNKLLRILLSKKLATPVNDLYAALNTLPIYTLHELQLLVFIHKFFHHRNLLPTIFHSYFTVNNVLHEHNTRASSNLHITHVNSNFGHRCSTYRGCKFWNELPDYLKLPSPVHLFKRNVKKYLMKRNSL